MSTFLGEGVPFTDNGKIDGTQTAVYTLPGVGRFVVESVVATIDASGSGDVTPELVIANPAGAVIATKRQGEAVSGGAPGSATWALRLADEGGGAVGATGTESCNDGFFGENIIVGGQVDLEWLNPAGDALLDLTNTRAPTIIAAGVYAVTTDVLVDRVTTATAGLPLYAQLYFAGGMFLQAPTLLIPWPAGGATPFNIGLSVTLKSLAGGTLKLTVANYNSATMNFNHVTTVQRIA